MPTFAAFNLPAFTAAYNALSLIPPHQARAASPAFFQITTPPLPSTS